MKRTAAVASRLAWVNAFLQVPEDAQQVTGVEVDGTEDTSAIVLLRPKAKDIVIPGAAALLDPRRVQAIAGAATRTAMRNRTRVEMRKFADIVWSLADVRNIYDSVDAATDWGRSYLYLAGDPREDRTGWEEFEDLKRKEKEAGLHDTHPAPQVIAGDDDALLVPRPWFHAHVRDDLGHNGLSEQRIATLMARAGWESLPTARSARTVHDPNNHARTIQFRFYVVPDGWLKGLEDE